MTDPALKALTYVEIDVPHCALTYSESPCTAIGALAEIGFPFKWESLPSGLTLSRAGANGTYFDDAGDLQTAAADVPRFTHDEVMDNLLLYSEQMDNAAWTSSGTVVVTANAATAPDGTATADRIADNDPAALARRFQSITIPDDDTTYTASCYLKRGDRDKVSLQVELLDGVTQRQPEVIVNLATGAIVQAFGAPDAVTISDEGDGWYRVGITVTNNSTGNVGGALDISPARDETFDAAATGYCYAWGAQIVAAAVPLAYTVTTSATRRILRGMLDEPPRTNSVANSTMAGSTNGAIGSGGALPTGWSEGTASGVTTTVVGTGTEDNLEYIDLRFAGTPADGFVQVNLVGSGVTVAADEGETWAASFWLRLVGGSWTNVSNAYSSVNTFTAGESYIATPLAAAAVKNDERQRVVATGTLGTGAIAKLRSYLLLELTPSAAIDITLRLYAPQLEKGTGATTPIKTAGTAQSRAGDIVTLGLVPGASYDFTLTDEDGETEFTATADAAGALVVGGRTVPLLDLETTGDPANKCFNSLATCQDRENFAEETLTLRFAVDTGYNPMGIEAIPNVESVSLTPGTVSLGEDLGTRSSLKVAFRDHPWDDGGPDFDKYRAGRGYDAFRRGTFWGKFRSRHPYLRGRNLRVIRGTLGQTLAEMETRHYVMDGFDGPGPDGIYTITAKDVLKLADGDRAQAPALSGGRLSASLSAVATAATLEPAGIGDEEYPASGHVCISGNEICAFTRSGDALTLTRGQLGTAAAAHDDDARVQLCLRYVGEDVADIVADLLETYAGVDAAYIPIAAWQAETADFLNTVYTATIAEPTAVKDLLNELIVQAALAIWWDDKAQLVRLQVLRAVDTTARLFDEDLLLEESFSVKEQPDKRISQAWTFYGQRDPTEKLEDADNYTASARTIATQAEADHGSKAIRKVFSRWIAAGGRTVAEQLNDILLARYQDPPRRFGFALYAFDGAGARETVSLGGGYRLGATTLQDATGAAAVAPIQVTRLNADGGMLKVEAEEMLYVAPAGLGNRIVVIDNETTNFNLRTAHDALYAEPAAGDVVICIVPSGVNVGSTSTATPAFDVGDWPAGVDITIQYAARAQGRAGPGGKGGDVVFPGDGSALGQAGSPGAAGGTAFYTRYPVTLEMDGAEIWGGGGGAGGGASRGGIQPAGGGGGGGGAGRSPGTGGPGGSHPVRPGNPGGPGTTEAGGPGGSAGDGQAGNGGPGGGPGLAGAAGGASTVGTPGGGGGPAGIAIDGISFVTLTGSGDIRGAQVN